MAENIVFFLKGMILVDVITRAARSWGIFDPLRSRIKNSSQFLNRLLSCYECTAVWALAPAMAYLYFVDWWPLTLGLIWVRLALWGNTIYEFLDAARAVREKEL